MNLDVSLTSSLEGVVNSKYNTLFVTPPWDVVRLTSNLSGALNLEIFQMIRDFFLKWSKKSKNMQWAIPFYIHTGGWM